MKRTRSRRCAALLIGSASLATSLPAMATYACEGHVQSVAVAPSTGIVVMTTDGGLNSVYLCQIDVTSNGSSNGPVSPTQCKAMLSLLMMAQATGQRVHFEFDDSLNCTTHPVWALLQGWYYGPVVLAN